MSYDLMPHGTKTYKDLHEHKKMNRTMPPLSHKYPEKLRDEKKVHKYAEKLSRKTKGDPDIYAKTARKQALSKKAGRPYEYGEK